MWEIFPWMMEASFGRKQQSVHRSSISEAFLLLEGADETGSELSNEDRSCDPNPESCEEQMAVDVQLEVETWVEQEAAESSRWSGAAKRSSSSSSSSLTSRRCEAALSSLAFRSSKEVLRLSFFGRDLRFLRFRGGSGYQSFRSWTGQRKVTN